MTKGKEKSLGIQEILKDIKVKYLIRIWWHVGSYYCFVYVLVSIIVLVKQRIHLLCDHETKLKLGVVLVLSSHLIPDINNIIVKQLTVICS